MALFLFDTPFGRMGLGQIGDAISHLYLPGAPIPAKTPSETPLFLAGKRQLLEYFEQKRRVFDLPLHVCGTAFQTKVWAALQAIPYGETRTYAQLAQAIGAPTAVRAVGGANHRNPLAILIPCHRVVGKNGSLTGYAGGLDLKQKLLELEQRKGHDHDG